MNTAKILLFLLLVSTLPTMAQELAPAEVEQMKQTDPARYEKYMKHMEKKRVEDKEKAELSRKAPEVKPQVKDSAQASNAYAEYSTPGKMQKMLADGIGEWDEKVTMWMAPGAPPVESNAKCTISMILGGRYQKAVTKGKMMGMPFEGQETIGFDNALHVFQSTWIDNFGTGISNMQGTYDEKTNTIEFKGKMVDPVLGKEVEARQTMHFVDKSKVVIEMFSTKNGKEQKDMLIVLTRAKAKK